MAHEFHRPGGMPCLQNWLVVLTILKNMSSSMGRMTSHIFWKNKNMFETTNQLNIHFAMVFLWFSYDHGGI
jgi:hypothetical protein